jgi:DNA-binding CsgD family transcriptional regulator
VRRIGPRAVYRRPVPLSAVEALLERERELGAFREGLDRACAGEGTLILVEGPAGVGKTGLLREARAGAKRAGVKPLEGRGSELEQPFAFGVVRQLLEPMIHDPRAGGDLFAAGAAPAVRLFEPEEAHPSGADGGFEALHSLYWLVVNLADRTPLAVLVDDCQWADLESLRFLAYLAQRIDGLPVAMALAGRPPDSSVDEPGSLWTQIIARPSAVALYPRPLSEAAAAAMTRERLGPDADEEFCRACHAATGGNPLFLRELLRALGAAAIAPTAQAATEVQSVGPAAVSRFVLHRLATLGPSTSELATAVAVLGDDTPVALAARVSGLTWRAARAAADDLVRADIFVDGERLGFVHPIVRAALYEDLAPGERQARHASAADALAQEGASAERITAHLLLTAPTADSSRVQTLRSAASAAARRGSPRAAAVRLRRALAESPSGEERGEILAELGRYEVAAMEFESAEAHLRAAVASDAGPATRAQAASWLARCAVVSGGRSAEAAIAVLESLSRELSRQDVARSLELGSDLLTVAAVVPRLRGDLGAHLKRFREQARGHPGFEAVARIHAAQQQVLLAGPAGPAADEAQAALATGLAPAAMINAGFLAVHVLRQAERYEPALRLLDLALDGARREGHAARQGLIHSQRAAIALARGALPDAQVEAETGLLLIEPPHFAVLALVSVAVHAAIERGAVDEAARLAGTVEDVEIPEDRTYGSDLLVARGRLKIAQGQLREGVEDLLWCGRRLEALNLRWPSEWRALAASALVSLGDEERAKSLARKQLATARRVGAPGGLGMSLRVAAAASGGDERLVLLEEAVAVLELSAARLELAYALADLGAELTRLRRRREGREIQRRAMTLASQCGASPVAERARADLQAGPGRRARLEVTGPDALTAAEWRVCRRAAEGHSNREVAEVLFVTEKTIERHLSSAYQKLGIRSRFQLAEAIGQ